MCSGLHPTHTTESGLGELVFICDLANRKKKKKNHSYSCQDTGSKIEDNYEKVSGGPEIHCAGSPTVCSLHRPSWFSHTELQGKKCF